jgi:Tol biopolymer transport system component
MDEPESPETIAAEREQKATGASMLHYRLQYDLKAERYIPYLGGISADQVAFSRDAQWVCHVSFPERNLWRCKSDGSQRLQLTFSPLRVLNPRWSPDGRRIAFSGQLPGSPWNIYLVPSGGGQPEHVLPEGRSQADVGWSPDGASLVFGEIGAESGKRAIEILNLSSRNVSVLPDSVGLFAPRWSPNGRYIAALPATSRGLRVFDWTSQRWTELATGVSMGWPDWAHDSSSIYFLALDQGSVSRVEIRTQKLSKIVNLQRMRSTGGWAGWWLGLSPDESPLVLRDAGSTEIYASDWKAP